MRLHNLDSRQARGDLQAATVVKANLRGMFWEGGTVH
jgi:hypothetical protein